MVTLVDAAANIERFEAGSLTSRLAQIERQIEGGTVTGLSPDQEAFGVSPELLQSALAFKQIAGQINVLIHAAGILLSLPSILDEGEIIQAVSLGAGNTGKPFDLETDRRIAEFKFINWRGGSEAIRQNGLFKDFYYLAESQSGKAKYLYVLGTGYPSKFLQGGRSLRSIMSRDNKMWDQFQRQYGDRFTVVREYYEYRKSSVMIRDISPVFGSIPPGSLDEVAEDADGGSANGPLPDGDARHAVPMRYGTEPRSATVDRRFPPPLRACLCGCGGTPRGGKFLPGHDAKLKGALLRRIMKGDESARDELRQLGWERFAPT